MIPQFFNALSRNTIGRLHQEYFVKRPQALLKRVAAMPAEQAPALVAAEFKQAHKRADQAECRAFAYLGAAGLGMAGLAVGDITLAPALIHTAAAVGLHLPVAPVTQVVALGSLFGTFASLVASPFQIYSRQSARMQAEIAFELIGQGKNAPQEAGEIHADVARRKEYLAYHYRTLDIPL